METGERIGTLRRAGLSRDGIAAALGIEPSQVAAYEVANTEPRIRDVLQVYEFGVEIPLADGWSAPAPLYGRLPAGLARVGDYVQGVGTLVWAAGGASAAEVVYPEWTPEDGEPSWEGGVPAELLPTGNVRGIHAWAYGGDFQQSGQAVELQISRTGQIIVAADVTLAPAGVDLTLLLDGARWLAL